ncbi:MAG: hypothetical protein KGM44_09265 [bacterium]|nr:hypothetical protein [bacterium]
MAIDHQHLSEGDYGLRESAGVPSAVVWLALLGFIVILFVGGFTAFSSDTNIVWPAENTVKIPLGS